MYLNCLRTSNEEKTFAMKHEFIVKRGNGGLVLGDSLEFLKSLPDHSVSHCITDPPYNISGNDARREIGWYKSNPTWREERKFTKISEDWDKFSESDYLEFTRMWISEVARVVRPNGNILVFGTYHNIYKVGYVLEELDRKIVNSIIWYKRNAFPNITQRMFCESTEQIVWAVNNVAKQAKNWVFNYEVMKKLTPNGKQMRNMWDIPMTPTSERASGKHPSQKPLAVMDRLVLGCTSPGDLVLDPFGGSGSTAVSAMRHGREFLLVEREPEYCRIAELRIQSENTLFAPTEISSPAESDT